MSITIEDFMKTATDEQKSVLFKLCLFTEQEKKLIEDYNKKVEPHLKEAKNASELKDGQYAQIIREDADDFALIATVKERQELKKVKEQMKTYMMKAVELGMGDLGIIERNYEHYVGEPLSN